MAGYGKSTAMAQQTLASTKSAELRDQLVDLQRQLDALGDAKPVDVAAADLKRHASFGLGPGKQLQLAGPRRFQRYCASTSA